jgi:hypothetical protein
MDPVSLAIISALTAGATSGANEAAKKAIIDSYEGLKSLPKKKFGNDNGVSEAIDQLQAKPDSSARRAVLGEELMAASAASDPELLSAAQLLLALIKALPQGEHHVQQIAQGIGIAQASDGSTATVTMSGSPGVEEGMKG